MPRPRLTILSLSTIHQDGRVLREIDAASRQYDVTVIGWGHLDKERAHVRMIPIQRIYLPSSQRALQATRMLAGRITPRAFERWYWAKPDHRQALQAVIASRPHLIHANEAISLPIAIQAARQTGAKVLFDAHEYSPEHRTNSLGWRLLAQPLYTYLIRHYAPQADAMITVESHIAQRYEQEFGVQVEVIRNAPPYQPLPFRPVDPQHIRMIHHGGAIRERQLETMIQVLSQTEARFTLDFMLIPSEKHYFRQLKKIASQTDPSRIRFIPPVQPMEISQFINQYDIGLFLIPPVNFNYYMILPNKLFEFIMAGLAVAIGPSPAMAALVDQYQCGIVADDFEPTSLARKLNQLTPQAINQMKQNALNAAKTLNAEHEMKKLLAIYHRLLNP